MSAEPGIHTISANAYHADPCERPSLSASLACVLTNSSPKHAWTAHPRLNPDFRRDSSERFDIGTAAHALLLQGEQIVHVVEAADWRTKIAQDVRDEARRNGLLPLLAAQWQQVQAMVAAVRAQLDAYDLDPPLLSDGAPEQTLVWEDHGVLCRARLDWLRDDLAAIDDLKTTARVANPAAWTRNTLWSIGADIQAAFYLRGLRTLTGATAQFRFVVVECAPPFALSVVSLAPSALELADAKVDAALNTWRRCLATDEWPAYPQQVAYAEAPGWALTDWMAVEEVIA